MNPCSARWGFWLGMRPFRLLGGPVGDFRLAEIRQILCRGEVRAEIFRVETEGEILNEKIAVRFLP